MDWRKERTLSVIRALSRGRKHRRPRRIPEQAQPDSVRVFYLGEMYKILDRTKDLINRRVVPRLALRRDALDDDIDQIEAEVFDTIVRPRDIRDIASKVANRTSDKQREELGKQIVAGVGVDVMRAEPDMVSVSDAFISQNVSLIRSVPARYLDDVERTLAQAMREGKRHEEIAKLLVERHKVARDTAKVIARDQVGKFFGELNRARQTQLGIDEYFWRTTGDNRVRPEHEALNGELIRWDDPPAVGIPGEDINCRCQAEPNFASLLGEDPAPAGERTSAQVPEEFGDLTAEVSTPEGFATPDRPLGLGVPTYEQLKEWDTPPVTVVRPSELAGKVFSLENTRPGNVARIEEAWADGKKLPPLKIVVDENGNMFVDDGRHRLIAALAEGKDRELVIEFEYASKGVDLTKNAVPVTTALKK